MPTPVPRRVRAAARLLVGALLAAALAGCGADGGQAPEDRPVTGASEVSMKNLQFRPKVIKIPVGTKVTWRFDDGSVPHNVIGAGFKSPTTAKGTFEHTFDSAGTFKYKCDLHINMTGEVIVG
jgi:plastocyanin